MYLNEQICVGFPFFQCASRCRKVFCGMRGMLGMLFLCLSRDFRLRSVVPRSSMLASTKQQPCVEGNAMIRESCFVVFEWQGVHRSISILLTFTLVLGESAESQKTVFASVPVEQRCLWRTSSDLP